eukprot:TRINITY_DN3505_c0_g1_i1.p1 TRINITY_DN3505_c0_g1~~TRINITY_DN3505_c0_g1_i1.p1  ORF type:complete len:421 (-),score=67.32 TRINITY_DN3505_c0_g1_i1:285-1547(-)
MNPVNPLTKMLLGSLKTQYEDHGDGCTSLVVLIGCLANQAIRLIRSAIPKAQIIQGFKAALDQALKMIGYHELCPLKPLHQSLLSTVSKGCNQRESEKIVSLIIDKESTVRDFQSSTSGSIITINSVGHGDIQDSHSVKGCLIRKGVLHCIQKMQLTGVRCALFSCPLEPLRIKTKIVEGSVAQSQYQALESIQTSKINSLVDALKENNVGLVLCQWGVNERLADSLRRADISIARWVSATTLELVSSLAKTSICPYYPSFDASYIGTISEVQSLCTPDSDMENQLLLIGDQSRVVTVNLYGLTPSRRMHYQESLEKLHRTVKSFCKDGAIVQGCGEIEKQMALGVKASLKDMGNLRLSAAAWSDALLATSDRFCAGEISSSSTLIPASVIRGYVTNATTFVCSVLKIDMMVMEEKGLGS